jgi:hypothetical protein
MMMPSVGSFSLRDACELRSIDCRRTVADNLEVFALASNTKRDRE